MSELNNITNSFSATLKDSDLQSVTTDLAETFSDALLNEGLLKEIPILGTLLGIGKAGFKIRDRLFLKKLLYFLAEINSISQADREKLITEIDSSQEYRTKVGEKLLYIIEKCEDHEKSQTMGRLFRAFLDKKIDYDSFLRCSIIVQRAMLDDLEWFVQHDWEQLSIEESADYLNWGVVEIVPLKIDLKQRTNYDYWDNDQHTYELEGGEIKTEITFIGKKIREALKQL